MAVVVAANLRVVCGVFLVGNMVKGTFVEWKKRFCELMDGVKEREFIHDETILHVLSHHPRYSEDMKYMKVTQRVRGVPKYFEIHEYKNGMMVDKMSWNKAIKMMIGTSKDSLMTDVNRYFRNVVRDQVVEFRQKEHGKWKPGYEVDHVIPFKKLIDDWVTEEGVDLKSLVDPSTGFIRSTTSLDVSFARYHRKHAVLQMLTTSEHHKKTYGW